MLSDGLFLLEIFVFQQEFGGLRVGDGVLLLGIGEQVSVLAFDTFQQRTAVKATTACGQVVGVFAFRAERLVLLAGLVRSSGPESCRAGAGKSWGIALAGA